MDWTDFFTALGMLLIFEAVVPFINPTRWRQVLSAIENVSDRMLRVGSFIFMIIGLLIIYIARSWV